MSTSVVKGVSTSTYSVILSVAQALTTSCSHVMDHLFAAYGLGASPALLKEIYGSHQYEQPVKSSPQEITDETFFQYLGDEK